MTTFIADDYRTVANALRTIEAPKSITEDIIRISVTDGVEAGFENVLLTLPDGRTLGMISSSDKRRFTLHSFAQTLIREKVADFPFEMRGSDDALLEKSPSFFRSTRPMCMTDRHQLPDEYLKSDDLVPPEWTRDLGVKVYQSTGDAEGAIFYAETNGQISGQGRTASEALRSLADSLDRINGAMRAKIAARSGGG